MSLIAERYQIPINTFTSMVKDGIISTDVVLQFEYAEMFKHFCKSMAKVDARKETMRYFGIGRVTLWRAITRFDVSRV